ncbi:MAG TPA: NAD-dependent epimerase/dehydratase family protein [Verrucomicrobiae bacterium]|nr:NAD-dependent epimerase/dehydratase family protein [Verrucomicrobiae bacterium]
MERIAIMGTGMVGGALDRALRLQGIQAGLYDPPKGLNDAGVLALADIIFIAVPTPYYLDGSGFDESFLRAAIQAIPVPGKTIVLKSTILPGTTERMQADYPMHRFLFNPEFLTETTADRDMQFPNRQIVGFTPQSRMDAERIMGLLPRAPFERIIPAREAELVKYFGNAFYALKVAYANQMFDLAQALGANYDTVKECAKAEPWMGTHHWEIFHKGYRGYGGKCLPKDTRAIIQLAERAGVDLSLLKQAERYNNALGETQGLNIQWEEGSPKKGKHFLVTGGAGFIGSNLVDALIADGHRVRVIDNLSTGKRERVHPQAEFILADFTNLDEIKPHFAGIDGVFHVGALPRIPFSIEQPVPAAEANVMGTLNVFVAARDAGVKRVVYSASSSAYGNQPELPLRPDMPPNPMNPYALHKYIGEKIAEQFHRFYGMETVSLRYFNVYGPRMADEGAYVTVISHFARAMREGRPLEIHGDGEQTRDFTHVFDVVQANILAMQSSKVGKGEVLNVGAGERWSINFIADLFGGPRRYVEGRKGEARDTQADYSKTTELIGWTPSVRFPEGLRDLITSLADEARRQSS